MATSKLAPIPHALKHRAAVETGCPRCYDSEPCPACQATAELLAIVRMYYAEELAGVFAPAPLPAGWQQLISEIDLRTDLTLAQVDELLYGRPRMTQLRALCSCFLRAAMLTGIVVLGGIAAGWALAVITN